MQSELNSLSLGLSRSDYFREKQTVFYIDINLTNWVVSCLGLGYDSVG